METKKQLPKVLYLSLTALIIVLVSFHVNAQDKNLKISDDANFIISENTFIKIPGNITLGEGVSGNLVMRGNTFNATGALNINAGSDLDITNGTFTVSSTIFNSASTVTYDGFNQEIKNWEYGHLVLNGTGNMSVSGDAATPTTCNTLTVNSTGNILKIPINKALTVTNAFTNNVGTSGVILESEATGDGSLISYTAAVEATINRYIKGNRWHYLSAPVDNASITNFVNTNNLIWWDATMEWGGLGDYDPWKSVSDSNLENALGYGYYYYEDTINYQGNMNVGDYSQTLYKSTTGDIDDQGWNLVGNPYTSILDWDVATADGAVPVGAENAIYLFDDDAQDGAQGNYRYYVPSTGGYGIGTNDATGSIPMGQGFFIKTNTDNVILNLKKDYRKHAEQEFYKSDDEFIKLEISNEFSDESIIRIIDNSTTVFDSKYDARKLFPNNNIIPQIFSIDINRTSTAINTIPEINEETIINLGVKAEEGEYLISLKDFNFFQFDVYLVDRFLNSEINLTKEEKYKFYYGGKLDKNRFYIAFQSLSSNINNKPTSYISIYPNPTNSIIKFSNTGNSKFKSITINSINGRICYKNNNAENIDVINLSDFSDGVYFIQINLSNGETYYNRIILQK